jgi:hypothetical protein
MLALKRFISRRGRPYQMYSNFVGVTPQLKDLGAFLAEQQGVIEDAMAHETINWHFIPAYAPHFGGLWEAGVKSCKYHLKRVARNSVFTFEELYSLLTQIEEVLNFRPLSPLSSDPHDLNPLTPSHFLIGRSMTSLPESNLTSISENRLNLFQKIEQMRHFLRLNR